MKAILGLMAAVLAAFASPSPLNAAPVVSPHAVTALGAETLGVAPGSTVWVAVVQTLDKGWHTYWRNPGDAGEATAIRWTLPAGWRAGAIAWPAPRRLPVGPIMNYGYEGEVVLPVPIEVPASAAIGSRARLSAVVDYLVCAEVCVPGSATVSMELPVVGGAPAADPASGPVISRALAASPKPGGLEAAFRRADGAVKLAVAGPALAGASAGDAYFYPYDETLIDHGKPQAIDRGPRGLTLTLAPGAAFAAGAVPPLASGVLAVGGRAYEIAARAGPPPAGADGLGAPGAGDVGGLLLAMGGAFLGGLILNLMPCVFPILSMKAMALAGHAGDIRKARVEALAFAAGVVISFLALAGALVAARAAGSAIGWGFQLQSPAAVIALCLIMLAAALNLSGLFEIGVSAQGLGSDLAARGGVAGAVFTGVLAVVVAAPCTAPFMGPALGFALTQPAPLALAVFLTLGLGFAAPFTLLSLTPGLVRRLPRPGAWMDLFKRALSFPMYGAAAWLLWVFSQQTGQGGLAQALAAAITLALVAWLYGLAQRRAAVRRDAGAGALLIASALGFGVVVWLAAAGGLAAPARTAATTAAVAGEPPSEPWSPERLEALRAAGRPVFVNFTAAWCVTCQFNERVVFSSPAVAEAFRRSGAAYLKADWTNRDSAIAQALASQGRIGVPLYLVYGPADAKPAVLPQLLDPAVVADALKTAARPRG